MSAITGIYHVNKKPITTDVVNNVMGSLKEFPCDDSQFWLKENVFLGCHAQWITPESINEQQPFYDYEKQLVITSDAIIDNRSELFDMLQIDHGDRKTMTDNQLILLAYIKWGENTPKFLIGDFAFMIWDERQQEFFGARDFSGSRTLYYYYSDQKFAFCSINKPLFQLPYIKPNLREEWLGDFLSIPWNFESIDTTSTVFEDINQLPPSHSISISHGQLKLTRYNTLIEGEKLKLKSNEEYEEALKEVFERAVTSRLRTHRKVGAHLSGGLDSGSVVGIAANSLKRENKQLHTFSYIPAKDFVDWTPKNRLADERPLIKATVNYVGNINDNYLDLEGKTPFFDIDDWLDVLEMPYKFFENTFWLKGIFEEAHSQNIGVLLNGQRGNWTISWGPALEYQARLLKKMQLMKLYNEISLYSENIGVSKSRIFSIVRRKIFSMSSLKKQPSQFIQMINPEFENKLNSFDKLRDYGIDLNGNSNDNVYDIKKKQFQDLFYWNITGTYGSKLSLRYSLWDRDPTNDLRVARFCLSVPEEQFVNEGLSRSLIRRSMKNILPDEVRLNQRTRGIQGADGLHRMMPVWREFIAELENMCRDSLAKEYLNIEIIKEAIRSLKFEPKPEDVYEMKFRILMRSLIFYRFIKKFN
ncbi:asparagine synthase-related protein [Guptibacillus spartinae]|uniref:asparagine synthase-related protein n=1 Tax=Guptibacillus spartinae TaxID=3025679 RepID=UPI00235F108D|nr:asparagine synthase-related protein [Pseudalkalibacillus spartinae]